jgi:hypothetical protein
MDHEMKRLLCFSLLVGSSMLLFAQQQEAPQGTTGINRNNLTIRPNSRDYTIVRKGNNHQQMLQMRTQAMMMHRQATMNRKMAMERRRQYMQQQMLRQQQVRQRMIKQRHVKH